MAIVNSQELTVTLNNNGKSYTYKLEPGAALLKIIGENEFLLTAFSVGENMYFYTEEDHTHTGAAEKIQKWAAKASPTVGAAIGLRYGVVGGIAGLILGFTIQQVSLHFPKETSHEGYYHKGNLIFPGRVVFR